MSVLDQFRLDGRVAVITGGSKGLGKSMAFGLAEAGATTLLVSRDLEACRAAAAEISRETGQRAAGAAADVANAAAVDRLVADTVDNFGHIDVWINAAGINIRHPVETFPVADFERILDVNIKGSWLCCRAVGRVMRQQSAGSVINIGSILGSVGLAERTGYCASKSAIDGLTRTLALEWADSGVRCNVICPGPFLTEINQAIADDPEKVRAVVGQTALQRWGELPEIRGAALFLASDASSYVTGARLFVDGGWSAG